MISIIKDWYLDHDDGSNLVFFLMYDSSNKQLFTVRAIVPPKLTKFIEAGKVVHWKNPYIYLKDNIRVLKKGVVRYDNARFFDKKLS